VTAGGDSAGVTVATAMRVKMARVLVADRIGSAGVSVRVPVATAGGVSVYRTKAMETAGKGRRRNRPV
jgi:hypothetical protein